MFEAERLLDILGDKTRFTTTFEESRWGSNFATLETKPSIKPKIKISINGKTRGWLGRFNTFYWALEVDGEERAREDCGDLFKSDFGAFLQQEFRKYSSIGDLISSKSPTEEIELIERTTTEEVEGESLEQSETALPFRDLSSSEVQEYFFGETEQQAPIIAEEHQSGPLSWITSLFRSSESSYEQAIAPLLEEKNQELKARVNEFVVLFKAKLIGRKLTKSEDEQYNAFEEELFRLIQQSNDSGIFAQMEREELQLYITELKKCGIELIEEAKEQEASTRKKSKQTPTSSTFTFSPTSTFLSFLLMTAGMPTAAASTTTSAASNASALTLYRPDQFYALTPQYTSGTIVRDSDSFLFGSTTYPLQQKQYYLRSENGLEQLLRTNRLSASSSSFATPLNASKKVAIQTIMPRIADIQASTSTALVVRNISPAPIQLSSFQPPFVVNSTDLVAHNTLSFKSAQSPDITPLYHPCVILLQRDNFVCFGSLSQDKSTVSFYCVEEQYNPTDSSALVPCSHIIGDSLKHLQSLERSRTTSYEKPSTSSVSIELLDDDGSTILAKHSSGSRYPQLLSEELHPLIQQPMPEDNTEDAALEQLHEDNEPEINQPLIVRPEAKLKIEPVKEPEIKPTNSTAAIIEETATIEENTSGSGFATLLTAAGLGLGISGIAYYMSRSPTIPEIPPVPIIPPIPPLAPIIPPIPPHSSASGSRILTPPTVSTSRADSYGSSSSTPESHSELSSPPSKYSTRTSEFVEDKFNAIAKDIIAKAKIKEEERKREIREQSETISGRSTLYQETMRHESDINCFDRLEDSTQRFLVLARTAENGLATNQINLEEARRMALGKSAKTEEEAKAHLSCTPDEIRYPNGKENIQNPFRCSASLNADSTTTIKIEILDPQMYKTGRLRTTSTYKIELKENQVFYDILHEINEKGLDVFTQKYASVKTL